MGFKYARISIRTDTGFKRAERMQARGWRVVSNGFDTILMEKKTERGGK